MAVQICTVSYVEYFANSQQIIFGRALRSNKWRLYESRNRGFRSRKLEEMEGGGTCFLSRGEPLNGGRGGGGGVEIFKGGGWQHGGHHDGSLAKIFNNVDLKTLTIFLKRFILDA